jgi:predicted permease
MVVGALGRGSRERLVELTPSQTRSLLGVAADIFSQSGGYIDPQTLSGGIWLSDGGERIPVVCAIVSSGFFQMLGPRPFIGRGFLTGEDEPNSSQVAVLSYRFWQSHYSGDPSVVGRWISINGRQYNVVGVMPPSFRFPEGVDLWVPGWLRSDLVLNAATPTQGSLYVLARLRPGVARSQAATVLSRAARELALTDPYESRELRLAALPLRDFVLGATQNSSLLLAIGGCAVLLLACLNVSNLLLIRCAGRAREAGVRVAMGASIADLRLQAVLEAALLAAVGALGGAFVLVLSSHFSATFLQVPVVDLGGSPSTLRIVAEALVLGSLCGLVCSSAPLLSISHSWIDLAVRESDRQARAVGSGYRLQRWLAGIQASLGIILAFAACLTLMTLRNLATVSWGFKTSGLWYAPVDFNGSHHLEQQGRQAILREFVQASAHLPGIESAAIGSGLPMLSLNSDAIYGVEGGPYRDADFVQVMRLSVTPDYFRTLGVRLIEGRLLSADDARGAPCAVVIDQPAAHALWPNLSPIGRHFRHRRDLCQVVGVVDAVRTNLILRQGAPLIYRSSEQYPFDPSLLLVFRTAPRVDPSQAIFRVANGLDAALDVGRPRRFEDRIRERTSDARTRGELCSCCAILALILAGTGIFASTLCTVQRRTREFALRMALGADRSQIYLLTVGSSLKLTTLGAAAGLAFCPLLYSRFSSLFFGIVSWPSVPLAIGTAVVLIVALAAAHLPARRAARLDPIVSLRDE